LNIDEGDPPTTAAMPPGRLAASGVDQNKAHGFCGGGEEVTATCELAIADEPQVRLMDQGRGVQRLAGLLLGQLLGCQSTQLVVEQQRQRRRRSDAARPFRCACVPSRVRAKQSPALA
jgi:hypothetical protein